MEILGYLGYAILAFFALTWALGVRLVLDMALPTIMGALYLMTSAVSLWLFDIDKIHSWWLLPSGYIFVLVCLFICTSHVPVLRTLIKVLGSMYAGIIRIGISAEKIKNSQLEGNRALINKSVKAKRGTHYE